MIGVIDYGAGNLQSVGNALEHLELNWQLVREPAAEFRLFSGYAGWGKGQLENEMKMGGWITTKATADYIFDDTAELWSRVSRDITRDVLGAEKHLKHFPDDPSVN